MAMLTKLNLLVSANNAVSKEQKKIETCSLSDCVAPHVTVLF